MPTDITKSHTITQINLSKPYHTGALLIDLKSRSSKSILDIKPLRKTTPKTGIISDIADPLDIIQSNHIVDLKSDELEQNIPQELVGDNVNILSSSNMLSEKFERPTLDFDQFNDYSKGLNPFDKSQYRDANQIKIDRNVGSLELNTFFDISKIEDQVLANPKKDTINTDSNSKTQNPIKTGKVADIKKSTKESASVFTINPKPKSVVNNESKPDLNNKQSKENTRELAILDNNRSLSKNMQTKRVNLRSKLIKQKYDADLNKFKTEEIHSSQNKDNSIGETFEFKTPTKFGSKTIPQFDSENFYSGFKPISQDSSRINLQTLNGQIHNSKLRKKIRNINKIKRYSVSTLFTTVVLVFCTLFLTGNTQWMGKFGNKNVEASKTPTTDKYNKWITNLNAEKYSSPGSDVDQDGLNNFEEFLLQSNPLSKNSCNNGFTDNQNLLNLTDPVSCRPIDFKNKAEVEKFAPVLNIPQEFINKIPNQSDTQAKIQQEQSTIPPLFENKSVTITLSSNSAQIMTDIEQPQKTDPKPAKELFVAAKAEISIPPAKPNEVKLLEENVSKPIIDQKINQKVTQYIDQYRSYDIYDNSATSPVSSDYYVDMSNRYNIPLKYVLALARSESRFGTDQYNQDGSSNRIGRHQNIFSIGLDDDGGSITYPTWESGVDALGRWYQNFDQQGYSDCAKWRIYNPNGDYCQKIENLANQIHDYINY